MHRPTGDHRSPDSPPAVIVWEASGSPWAGVGYGDAICWHLSRAGFAPRLVSVVERMPSPDELAASRHVLSGGEASAHSSALWMVQMRGHLERLVGRALTGDAAVIGIGLGAQLLAATLAGGAIRDVDGGVEAGMVRVTAPDGDPIWVAQLHQQQIDPAAIRAIDGQVVLTGNHCKVQGFTLGNTLTGYQFHPELDPDALERTLRTHANLVRRHGADLDRVLATVTEARDRWRPDTFEQLVAARLRQFRPRRIAASQPPAEQPRWATRRDRHAEYA